MKKRALRLIAILCVVGLASACNGYRIAQANQMEQINENFSSVKKGHDAKHTPKIEAPKQVEAGEWFEVTITIGADKLHPTMDTHYINWIALFKNDVEIARAYLNPVHTMPKVTFTIALEKSCTLRVLEQPNHTAPWEARHKIKVVKKKS